LERPVILVVLVDALGWEVVQDGGIQPWLGDLLPHRRPLTTVLGFSSGAIPALLSGTWPSENGRWLMYSRASGETPLGAATWFARLPERLRRSYRVSQVLHRQVGRRVQGYFSLYEVPWRLLPHFDLAERKPLFAPGGLNGHPTWFDRWAGRGYRVRAWDWRTPEKENAEGFVAACGAGRDEAADVLFWYTPGQDACQHRLGTRADGVQKHLDWLGGQIREGALRAQAAGRTAWVYLFSDHGMTDVTAIADVMGEVRNAVSRSPAASAFEEGRDWLPFYDSTMARFWWPSERAHAELRPVIVEHLNSLGCGSWLDDENLRALGCHFDDHRYGEDIFLLDPGALLAPSYMGTQPVKGMHGYDPDEPSSRAIVLSNRPLAADMKHVVDVAPFIESETGARDECPARS
jgi:hypothetical protein